MIRRGRASSLLITALCAWLTVAGFGRASGEIGSRLRAARGDETVGWLGAPRPATIEARVVSRAPVASNAGLALVPAVSAPAVAADRTRIARSEFARIRREHGVAPPYDATAPPSALS